MNRRETIKTLMAASGSFIALPAWAEGWRKSDLLSSESFLSAAGQETLSAMADTIIPAGDSIGAISVGVDKFLQKLIADCYEQDVRDNVNAQLDALDGSAKSLYGRSFKDCDQPQREAMLSTLAATADTAKAEFFSLIKSETIRGFNTSREVMVNYHKFRQVPGHYYGCIDVNA